MKLRRKTGRFRMSKKQSREEKIAKMWGLTAEQVALFQKVKLIELEDVPDNAVLVGDDWRQAESVLRNLIDAILVKLDCDHNDDSIHVVGNVIDTVVDVINHSPQSRVEILGIEGMTDCGDSFDFVVMPKVRKAKQTAKPTRRKTTASKLKVRRAM